MFSTLLETNNAPARRGGGSLLSVVVHVGAIAALVIATANASVPTVDEQRVEQLHFTKPAPTPPVPVPPSAKQVYTAAPQARGFSTVIAPIDIPSVLPNIDLSVTPTDQTRFSARGVQGGSPDGIEGGTIVAPANGVYSALQVEKAVVPLPGATGPAYPEMLRSAGVEGSVLATFVVDTSGRADLVSFTVQHSDHALFASAVRTALARMRFLPAEAGGRKVPQLVQQTFQFNLNR